VCRPAGSQSRETEWLLYNWIRKSIMMFTNNKSTMNLQDYIVMQFKELLKKARLWLTRPTWYYVCKNIISKYEKLSRRRCIYDTKPLLCHKVATEYYGEDSIADREFELVQCERDLLRRKIELMRRETKRGTVPASGSPSIDGSYHHPKGLKNMLSEFDDFSNAFRNWK